MVDRLVENATDHLEKFYTMSRKETGPLFGVHVNIFFKNYLQGYLPEIRDQTVMCIESLSLSVHLNHGH